MDRVTIKVVRFPVLTMKDDVVSLATTQDELGLCTPTAFKRNWHKGLKIVDSDGVEYLVTDALNPQKTGLKLFRGLFAPKLLKVDLKVQRSRNAAVDEIRQAVKRGIFSEEAYWPEEMETAIQNSLDNAASIQKLLDIFRSTIDKPTS